MRRSFSWCTPLGRGMTAAGGGRPVVSRRRRALGGRDARRCSRRRVAVAPPSAAGVPEIVGHVLALAMRPFLSSCAEVLQRHPDLSSWAHAHCALCGGEPDSRDARRAAAIAIWCAAAACCSWRFDPLACPFCLEQRSRPITSFGHQRRPVSRLRLRRLPPLPEGVRRAPRVAPADAHTRRVAMLPLDAAAMQRGYIGLDRRARGSAAELEPLTRVATRKRPAQGRPFVSVRERAR